MTYNISSVVINLDIIRSRVEKKNLQQVCKEREIVNPGHSINRVYTTIN